MSSDLELVLRVLIATVVGGVLGLEREMRGHEPGMRTHALVAVGAALFTIAGAYGFADSGVATADPTRVAAQVATGIGFIGAGAVLRSGVTVRGLTTAATLWVSAAVGVAAGAGVYLPLVAATAATLVVLVGVNLVKTSLLGRFGVVHRLIRIEYRRGHGTIGPVIRQLEQLRCRIRQLQVEDDDEDCQKAFGVRRVTICVQTHDQDRLATAVNALERREEILTIAVEPLAG